MPRPERERPGYLRRVLADGARPAQVRGGMRVLVGAEDHGATGAARGMGPDFVYAHLAAPLPDAPADSRTDAGESAAHGSEPAPHRTELTPYRTEPAPHRSEPTPHRAERTVNLSEPRVRQGDPGAGAPLEFVIARDVARAAEPTPRLPAGRHGVEHDFMDAAPRGARNAGATSNKPAVASPSPAVTAILRPMGEAVQHASISPRATRVTDAAPAAEENDARAFREARDAAPATFTFDPEKLSPAMRAVLPFLGRIRAAGTSPSPAPDGAGAQAKRDLFSRQLRPAPGVESVRDTGSASPSRAFPRLDAAAAARGAGPDPTAPAAPPPRGSGRSGVIPQHTMTQLRKAVHALAAKAGARAVAPTDTRATANDPQRNPLQRVERVVTTRVLSRAPVARAFWERRYLGRPHMRAYR